MSLREKRELWLPLAAEERQVDLDRPHPSRLRERRRLRLHLLRGQDAAAVRARGIEPDERQVARELLDRLDRADALDLDGDPAAVLVAAHQVDRPDVRRPFAPLEPQRLAERVRL